MWIAVGCLGLLVLAALGIGAGSPVQHRASRTMILRKNSAEVYNVIAGPPDWHPGVARWKPAGAGIWTEFDQRGRVVI